MAQRPMNSAANKPIRAMDAAVLDAAATHLRIGTLEERRTDALDFHECHIADIAAALQAAYRAGQASAAR